MFLKERIFLHIQWRFSNLKTSATQACQSLNSRVDSRQINLKDGLMLRMLDLVSTSAFNIGHSYIYSVLLR